MRRIFGRQLCPGSCRSGRGAARKAALQFLALTAWPRGWALHAGVGGITPISFSGGRRVVNRDSGRILRPAMGCRDSRKRGARGRARRPGPAIWWCQAVRSAKARVTAAVRLETCSSR